MRFVLLPAATDLETQDLTNLAVTKKNFPV
jgi:hypothetical protein